MASLCKKRKKSENFLRATKDQKKSHLIKKKKGVKFSSSKGKSKDIQYYNCKGYYHIVLECLARVKYKKLKKDPVANATWDDSSKSKFELDESHHEKTESNYVSRPPQPLVLKRQWNKK